MDPITLSALIGGGGALLSTGASLFGASQQASAQQGIANQQAALAQRQMEMQLLMQLRGQSLQQEQLDYQRGFGERSYNDQQRLNERAHTESVQSAREAIARAERDRQYAIQQNEIQNATAKQQYADSLAASRSGRIDSAGNKVYYDAATNTWKTDVAPGIKALMDASQRQDLEAMVKGGYRREQGQEANFKRRLDAGGEADSLLKEYERGIGAPSLEAIQGRDTVAGVTRAGAGRDMLTEALSRSLIRSGGSNAATDATMRSIDNAGSNNVRVAIADAAANAPEKYRAAKTGWRADLLNARAPLAQEAGNITDAPFASAQTTTSADSYSPSGRANPNTTYGGGSGAVAYANNEGSTGYQALLKAANAGSQVGQTPQISIPGYSQSYGGYDNMFKAIGNQPTQQSPWGSAIGAATDNIQALLRRFGSSNSGGIDQEIANWSNYGVPGARTF